MNDLELQCDIDPDSACVSVSKRMINDGVMLRSREHRNDADIALNKDQARQLHEWLWRYLENSDD